MKKFFILLVLCLISQPVFAKTIPVQALENFSTDNPPKTYSIKVLDDLVLDENVTLKENDILEGKIVDIKDPKRLKRDATFTFVPEVLKTYTGQVVELKGYYPAKYTTKLNKKDIAKSAALSVGNHFVKGLSMGYSAIEGAVKNEKDNRLKSSVNSLYESSPLSYVEKGHAIEIAKDQVFLLNFKAKDVEDIPNYEYEQLPEDNN